MSPYTCCAEGTWGLPRRCRCSLMMGRAFMLLASTLVMVSARRCATYVGPTEQALNSAASHQLSSDTAALHGRNLAQFQFGTSAQPLGVSPPGPPGSHVPGFTVVKHVPDSYLDMPGGWYELKVDYQFPQPNNTYGYLTYNRGHQCFNIAKDRVREPMSDLYRRRRAPPTPLPGGVPRAFWRWEGVITRDQFDAVPEDIRLRCRFCHFAIKYQIIDGHLYRKGNEESWAMSVRQKKENVATNEDILLLALHLWDLPDMDIILHNGDGCPPDGWPMLSWSVCRDRRQAGFSWPTHSLWHNALGPVQNHAYHECMITRYSLNTRRPVVFWRGSTTDPVYGSSLRINVVHKVKRMQVHKMFEDDVVIDAKVTKVKRADECMLAYMGPLGTPAMIEDYAQNAIAMDLDGHGASFRFGHRFVHLATPIFKQASNMTTHFEHLVAPGVTAEYFKNDLTDLKGRGYQLVNEWKTNPARLIKQAEQMQGLASALMHQIGLAEAAAYSLLEYSKKQTWKTVRDSSYTHIPFSQACYKSLLPQALCEEMQARPPRP